MTKTSLLRSYLLKKELLLILTFKLQICEDEFLI